MNQREKATFTNRVSESFKALENASALIGQNAQAKALIAQCKKSLEALQANEAKTDFLGEISKINAASEQKQAVTAKSHNNIHKKQTKWQQI